MSALGKLEGLLWLHEGPGSPVLTWWVRTGPVLVCASWATGQCLSQAIGVATRSGVPVSLPSIVFQRNFFKAPPFPFTDYLGIRVFQLPVVSPSLRLNCKKSRCAAKKVSAFYNL